MYPVYRIEVTSCWVSGARGDMIHALLVSSPFFPPTSFCLRNGLVGGGDRMSALGMVEAHTLAVPTHTEEYFTARGFACCVCPPTRATSNLAPPPRLRATQARLKRRGWYRSRGREGEERRRRRTFWKGGEAGEGKKFRKGIANVECKRD